MQGFAYIPYEYFIGYLDRSCREYEIVLVLVEESYTSQASLLDGDAMPVWTGKKAPEEERKFSGTRVHRGLGHMIDRDFDDIGGFLFF